MADVGDAVEDHGEAVEAHAEGEAGDLVGVQEGVATGLADSSKDGGVHHAAAGDLDPAGLPALGLQLHVDLKAGLGEGEEVRTEADGGAGAEDFAEEELQRALEVSEGDVLVHIEGLDLVEDAQMSGVDLVTAIGGPGGDDAHGQVLHRFQGADLHAGGVGAQQLAIGHVEGVALIAGRVVGGRVEGIKAMPLGLHLRSVGEGEAHAAQGAHGEITDLGEGVEAADSCTGAARQGEVDARHGGGVFGGLEGILAGGEALGDGVTHFVQFGAHILFLLDRHVAHAGAEGGELAFLAEVIDAEGLERRFIGERFEGGEGLGFEGVEFGEHGDGKEGAKTRRGADDGRLEAGCNHHVRASPGADKLCWPNIQAGGAWGKTPCRRGQSVFSQPSKPTQKSTQS